jgi:kelch-like protein 20
MGTKRLGVAVAVLDGFLYAIGGSDGQCPLNTGRVLTFYRSL